MTKSLSPVPRLKFVDTNNSALSSGKLYTYTAGTTTPLSTYTDSTGGTANANPVILDSNGEADVWLDQGTQYKYVLKTSGGTTIWTIDYISGSYIYGENITWTGTHTFNSTATFPGGITGAVTFSGAVTMSSTLHVIGAVTLDGAATFGSTVTFGAITASPITLGAAGTISDATTVMQLSAINNMTVKVDNSAFTYDFQESGLLRLPNVTPVNDNDAARKKYVDDKVTAGAPTSGLVPVAACAVVANALVAGSVGIASVTHTATGTYVCNLSAATTSTGKTIAITTVRNPAVDRCWCAFPNVVSTTQVTVRTGGGNTFAITDQDFNMVVYSLP